MVVGDFEGRGEIMSEQGKCRTLSGACAELREVLDCDANPGMIGSPVEVVLEAKGEIERLRMENASLNTPQPGAEQNYYFMLQGAKQELAQLRAQLAALHGKIMAIDSSVARSKWEVARYRPVSFSDWDIGFRAGRHAAAELCAGMGSADVVEEK